MYLDFDVEVDDLSVHNCMQNSLQIHICMFHDWACDFLFSFDSYMYGNKNHTTLKLKRHLPYFTDRHIKISPWNSTLFVI